MGIDGREGNQERERERRGKGGNEKVKEQVRQRESWRVVGLREVLHYESCKLTNFIQKSR